MDVFTKFTAVAAPLDATNVDTDQIIPAPFLSRPRAEGYHDLLFYRVRRMAGEPDPGAHGCLGSCPRVDGSGDTRDAERARRTTFG